jgi:hypothetical protein
MDKVLATGLTAAGGHSGTGAAAMFAVLAGVALAVYGVARWRQRRGRGGNGGPAGRP